MFRRKRHLCPCCGYLTLEDTSPGSHLICPICFWEDDPLQFQPAYLTGFRSEDSEVPCTVVFSTRGARSRTRQYVEHTKARKRRWVRCIAVRSWKLVRYAGLEPDWEEGANVVSLRQAQRNFREFGCSEERFREHVRSPTKRDRRGLEWRPLE